MICFHHNHHLCHQYRHHYHHNYDHHHLHHNYNHYDYIILIMTVISLGIAFLRQRNYSVLQVNYYLSSQLYTHLSIISVCVLINHLIYHLIISVYHLLQPPFMMKKDMMAGKITLDLMIL